MQKHLSILPTLLFLTAFLQAQPEPSAGAWKTWFIDSGPAHRLPPPPAAKKEIEAVIARQETLDSTDWQQIQYWNAGAPSFRWQNLMSKLWMTDTAYNGILSNMLLSVAIYDATVAAWDSKYAWKRPRPFEADSRVQLYAPRPQSPSYPCEHSVAAGAAVAIIAHFFPSMADSAQHMAQRAMDSRVAAGVAFPGDTRAGFELGQKIAALAIARTRNFAPKTPWNGEIPQQAGLWNGEQPMLPLGGLLETMVLDSGSQFRPGPPPDYAKEMAELKSYRQTFRSMSNAFFHATQPYWSDLLDQKIFEYNLHQNPPAAARIYAVAAIGTYDGFVACWDAKYAYWAIRPEQYDTTFHPLLFQSPPFPGYPSGHAAISSVMAELYSYFFPAESAFFRRKAKEVAESRFQGGIHFRSDNEVALVLGQKVAAAIVNQVKNDGATPAFPPRKKAGARAQTHPKGKSADD